MSTVTSVTIGRVTKIDPGPDPGWVEVEFPVEDGNTRMLARIATAMAGPDRGMWFMPEEQDEVLIACENGHSSQPYVVGYLWHGDMTTPDTTREKRLIKSKRGHTITFDDSDANKIEIKTASGHTVTLDDSDANKKIEVKTASAHTITLDDGSANKIELKAAGQPERRITIDSSGVTLKAGGRQLAVTASTVELT